MMIAAKKPSIRQALAEARANGQHKLLLFAQRSLSRGQDTDESGFAGGGTPLCSAPYGGGLCPFARENKTPPRPQ
jgi:hypothetical protein